MKKKILLFTLTLLLMLPFKVFAAGGFSVSNSSINMYPGDSKTITVTTQNAVGKLNISSGNSLVASAGPNAIFIENPGSSQSITITANSVGTTTVSVVASNNFATMDEEILVGLTRTISVNVVAKQVPANNSNNNNNNNGSSNTVNNNTSSNNNSNNKTTDNRSKNNNIKELSVEGHNLTKVDNNNYTLTVSNDVTSINVKATVEDSKSKVTGAGNHDINVGENNIEIVVTAENGSQNKINIKVTRKDGYYIEDLESALNNSKISDINITINSDTKLTANDLEKLKNSKKTVKFNYYNDDKKLVYSWIIYGSKLKNTNDLLTTITFDSNNKKNILRLSNYADGLFVGLKQTNNLPMRAKLKLFVGNKYEDNELVNVYSYTKNNEKLKLLKDNIKVDNGYIEFDAASASDYFVTMSNISNTSDFSNNAGKSLNVLPIIISFIGVITLALVIIFIIKRKKINDNNSTAAIISNEIDDNKTGDFKEDNNISLDFENNKKDDSINISELLNTYTDQGSDKNSK